MTLVGHDPINIKKPLSDAEMKTLEADMAAERNKAPVMPGWSPASPPYAPASPVPPYASISPISDTDARVLVGIIRGFRTRRTLVSEYDGQRLAEIILGTSGLSADNVYSELTTLMCGFAELKKEVLLLSGMTADEPIGRDQQTASLQEQITALGERIDHLNPLFGKFA